MSIYNPNDPQNTTSFADLGIKIPQKNEFTLNGKRYVIKKHGVRKYFPNLISIGKIFLVPLSYLSGLYDSIADGHLSGADLQEALPSTLQALFMNLDQGQFLQLSEIVLDEVLLNDKQVVLEDFDDNPEELFVVLAKTLEVRYSSLGKIDFTILSTASKILGMVTQATKESQGQSNKQEN